MAFDLLSWAIGFTLSRTASRLLKKSEAGASGPEEPWREASS
jgi:hypothetical protein